MTVENKTQPKSQHGGGRWMGAAGAAALFASACCLGPVVLAGLGLSAAGLSASFEPLRPAFLVLTAGLLGVAFYLTYFRRPACGPGAACAVDDARTRRTRTVMWLVTIGIVLVALFPVYGGGLLRMATTSPAPAGEPLGRVVRLEIEGMTCGACAVSIEKNLRSLSGVRAASVRYPDGNAIVETTRDGAPTDAALVEAVADAGYLARLEE